MVLGPISGNSPSNPAWSRVLEPTLSDCKLSPTIGSNGFHFHSSPIANVHVHGDPVHCSHLPYLLHNPGENPWGSGKTEWQSSELPECPTVTKRQELPELFVYGNVKLCIGQVDGYCPIPWSYLSSDRFRRFHNRRRISIVRLRDSRSITGLHFPFLGTKNSWEW